MNLEPVPFRSRLEVYRKQAEELLEAWRRGDSGAVRIVRTRHPRLLDDRIPWLPKKLSDSEVRSTALELVDAQLTVARCYDFQSWPALEEYVKAVTREDSPVWKFEAAVEAVIRGDAATVRSLLREEPGLPRARSTRITHFDPPAHRATLLHYVAANGVEGYRQKTPENAVEIAGILLRAGAEVDALADMYGGQCATLSLLVSSSHPANAGVQVPLVDTLLDFGAAIEGVGAGRWTSPLRTALAFGYRSAAEALVRRGARVDRLDTAAGLGRLAVVRQMLPAAGGEDRHRALALAAGLGQVEMVGLLLDAGVDPNRYNPEGNHAHSTPLHQAVWAGHASVVRLLVQRGARLDLRDAIYQGTPLGWAEYGGRAEIAEFLRAHGAKADAAESRDSA